MTETNTNGRHATAALERMLDASSVVLAGEAPGQFEAAARDLCSALDDHDVPRLARRIAIDDVRRALAVRETLAGVTPAKPVATTVICGLPRTGSTLLQHLLSLVPVVRTPTIERSLAPVGGADVGSSATRLRLALMERLAPEAGRRHPMSVDGPEECLPALSHVGLFVVPAVMLGITELFDRATARVEALRCYLQLVAPLTADVSEGTIPVLKSPIHTLWLSDLREADPTVRLVITHRDPVDVIASSTALVKSVVGALVPDADLEHLSNSWIRKWADAAQALVPLASRDDILHVGFDELTADPVGVACAAARWLGAPEDAIVTGARRMSAWLEEHPRSSFGAVSYPRATEGVRTIDDHAFQHYRDVFVGAGALRRGDVRSDAPTAQLRS